MGIGSLLGPGWKGLNWAGLSRRVIYIAVSVIVTGTWYWEYNVAPVTIMEYAIASPRVTHGGVVRRKISVIRHRSCTVDTSYSIIDSDGDRITGDPPPLLQPGPLGVVDTYFSGIILPPKKESPEGTIPSPGPAVLNLTIDYTCSWVHRIFGAYRVVQKPLRFTIVP